MTQRQTYADACVSANSRAHAWCPSEGTLSALASGFGGFVRNEVERSLARPGQRAGSLSAEAAGWPAAPEISAPTASNGDMGGKVRSSVDAADEQVADTHDLDTEQEMDDDHFGQAGIDVTRLVAPIRREAVAR